VQVFGQRRKVRKKKGERGKKETPQPLSKIGVENLFLEKGGGKKKGGDRLSKSRD